MRGGLLLQNTPLGCICRVAGCRTSRLDPFGTVAYGHFLFSFKKKGAKPLRAKSCPFGAVALRDAAAAAEMLTPYKVFRPLRRATRAPP